MQEEAQKILIGLLKKASDGVDSAVSFSQAQIPDVIHQLLVWNAVSSALFQIAAILIVTGYLFSIKKSVKTVNDYTNDFCVPALVWLMIGGAAAFVMFIGFWLNFDWLKIWLAPKLYLIEYAASIMK